MNDVSAHDGRAAPPPKKTRLAKLSPGFLTEEDAARWVQLRIPADSDREHGSVILRQRDGQFVATEPVPGEVNRFDLRTLLDVDAQGNYVHPSGYTCVANVHSHPPAHDKIRAANPGQDELTLRLFLGFFSDIDFVADVSERTFFSSAYLCGPDGSLLKYSPSGSREELSYYLWLKAGAPRDNPVGVYGVANVIRKIASLGELTVIVSNKDWGESVGKVPTDWKPGRAFSKGEITQMPALTRVCISAEHAVLAALKAKDALSWGLVLRDRSAQAFVATQARRPGRAAWTPASFFPAGDDGQLKLPAGYQLEGFYYASRPDPALYPPHEPWLYENFFTPQDMALAVACHRDTQRDSNSPLSLYMQAGDSSLLKYSFSGSALESALSTPAPDGAIGDGGRHARLRAGALRPSEYVSEVALAGRLDVLRASALWARPGLVDRDWQSFAGFSWPILSPLFLSADDAARYLHRQIGHRRDRQFAGYIFQRSDRRFVATLALEGGIESLGSGHFYPHDNAGRPVFPDDLVLHSRYVSHKALSLLDPEKVQRLKWTRQEAALSLQMFSVEEMRQVLLDERPLYLSGSAHSLLRFEPFETGTTRAFDRRLGTHRHPGPLATELETGMTLPTAFIKEQAAAGRLTVVLNSELWGPRGQVTPDWSAAYSPWKWKRPEQVAFGAVFATADEAAEDQYSRDVRLHEQEKAWFGFILKHKDREEYVASELIPIGDARNDVFQPQSLFGITTTPPWYTYPEGFQRHAFFYSRQRLKHSLEQPASWLSQHFILPDDLFPAVYYSRRRRASEPATPIALYISTQDGALLKFDNRQGNRLFDNDVPGLGLDDFKSLLTSGKMQPDAFVRTVIKQGGLHVMRTSLCWDRPGPVDPDWRPFMHLQRRWLSPAFKNMDDAAVYARSRLPEQTGKIFGGLLLIRPDGLYLSTEPVEVASEDFDVSVIYPAPSVLNGLFPDGCKVAGRYRSRVVREPSMVLSHLQKQTYLNLLSVDTLFTAFNRKRIPAPQADPALDEYLFGPQGSIIRYRSGRLSDLQAQLKSEVQGVSSDASKLDGNAVKQLLYSGALKPGAWCNCLTGAGDLYVVSGSRFWGPRRKVTEWQPYPVAATVDTKADIAPLCSPLFIQADAAARHVHEATGERTAATFGVMLWGARDGLFYASLPLETHSSAIATDRVLVRGAPPAQYAVHALYACARRSPAGEQTPECRQFLFSPLDIHHLCSAAYTPQGYRLIYLSCADGALLRFAMSSFEPGEFHDARGQLDLRPNLFASKAQAAQDEEDLSRDTFNLPDYIRRMARAGELDVIVTSAYWSRHGRVDENWQPRMADVLIQERWRANPEPPLGPVFEHCDDAARYIQQRAGSGYVHDIDKGFDSAILARPASPSGIANRFVPLDPLSSSATGENSVNRIFRPRHDPSRTLVDRYPTYPQGYEPVASHQLHLSGNTTQAPDTEQVYANFASPLMVRERTHDLKNKGFAIRHYYYSSPHDVLLRYTPEYTDAERDLLSTTPVVFEGGRWVTRLKPEEFISRLVDLGDFRVLIAGHYWRQVGPMGKQWKLQRQQTPSPGIVHTRDEL
jgi:hypothetical protein